MKKFIVNLIAVFCVLSSISINAMEEDRKRDIEYFEKVSELNKFFYYKDYIRALNMLEGGFYPKNDELFGFLAALRSAPVDIRAIFIELLMMKDKLDKDIIFYFVYDSEIEALRLFLDLIPMKDYIKGNKANLQELAQLDIEILSQEKIDLFRSIGFIE